MICLMWWNYIFGARPIVRQKKEAEEILKSKNLSWRKGMVVETCLCFLRSKMKVRRAPERRPEKAYPSNHYCHPGPAYHNFSLPKSLLRAWINDCINPLMGHTQPLWPNLIQKSPPLAITSRENISCPVHRKYRTRK